jgi:hypothetical protein
MYVVCCAVIGLCTSWGPDAPSVQDVPQGCSPSDADIMINIKAGFSRLGTWDHALPVAPVALLLLH